MYILKNSIKNLFRNRGRNIIVAVIILAMLTFTAISMIINTTTDNVIKNYKEQFGSQIYMQYDLDKIKKKEQSGERVFIPEIPDHVKLAIADSKYLKEAMIRVWYPAYSPDLKGLDQDKKENNSNSQGGTITNGAYYDINLNVYGYNTPDLMTDFKEGKRKITRGRMFNSDYECIISEDYAKLNSLKLGDKVKIHDCAKDAKFGPLELTVVGIYYDGTENKFGNIVSAMYNPRNDILTTYNTMKHYEDNVAKGNLFAVDATYFLKNPDLLEEFNKEAHQKGLNELYMMSTDENSYNRIVKPAESLANVANIFLIAVLIIGSVILVLLSVLSIRERKYEIGVLRAMGMKKLMVVRGIIYESLITIGICLVIGLSIGAATAQPVSDMITKTQYEQSQSNTNWGGAQVEQQDIKVSLTPQAVLNVSAIAIVLAIISNSTGVLYILRYEPMKILSERN